MLLKRKIKYTFSRGDYIPGTSSNHLWSLCDRTWFRRKGPFVSFTGRGKKILFHLSRQNYFSFVLNPRWAFGIIAPFLFLNKKKILKAGENSHHSILFISSGIKEHEILSPVQFKFSVNRDTWPKPAKKENCPLRGASCCGKPSPPKSGQTPPNAISNMFRTEM